MGQGSRWASVIYPLKESKWAKGKMSCCCLPPDRVKVTVNNKKETAWSKWAKGQDGLAFLPSERVKMIQVSRWAGVIYPLKSQTNSERQERVRMDCYCLPPEKVKLTVHTKKETNSRVKMGQGSRWAAVVYPLTESN